MNEQLIQALNKRYATKKFDPTKLVSAENLSTLIEAVRLAPTSYGLQLMKIVVVENKTIRAELLDHSYGQKQVVDASHLLVLCREKEVDTTHIDAYITTIATTRNISKHDLEGFGNMMRDSILGMSEESQKVWMEKQIYIALGNLLSACALLQVDSCPMEGFVAAAYDRILSLGEKNLSAVLTVPIGYRSIDDANATLKKVRRSNADFVVNI